MSNKIRLFFALLGTVLSVLTAHTINGQTQKKSEAQDQTPADFARIARQQLKTMPDYDAMARTLAAVFKLDRAVPIGGAALINPQLYILIEDDKNELLLGKEHDKWTGASREIKQAVIVFQNKVVDPQKLPADFDLSKSIMISFQVDKAYFFDFNTFIGAYYPRKGEKD